MKSPEPATPVKPMRRVIPFRRAHERRGEELAFLPAALEIVETPPSPIGRAIATTIILLFCAALVWAWWGTIDIVASASGKIVPSGRTKVVQPFETGVVRSIRVEDGQAVKAGDVLIELDPTVNAAERDHLRSDLLAEQLNIARLRAALAAGDDPLADFTPPAEADPALLRTQRQLLLHQVAEHRAKIAALGRQQAQKEAEHATTAATIHKLETVIPAIQPRVDIRKTLMEKELGSKLTYFETLQLLVEQQEELSVQKSHLHAAEAAVAAIRETRGQAVAEYRRTLSDELAKAEQKANGLTQDLIKAEQKTRLQQLAAPVDGVVQQLAIHTVGGVVTPAQSLLMVVPSDSRLEIEAMVSEQRADGPGAQLQRAHLARPHQNANRRPNGQSIPRHGGDGGNQDRIARDPELSLVAAHPLPAGDPARAVKRAADKRNGVAVKRAVAIPSRASSSGCGGSLAPRPGFA